MTQNRSTQNRHHVCITEVRTTLVHMTDAELEQAKALREGRWSLSHDEISGVLVIHHIQVVPTPEFPGTDLPWKLQEPA